MYPSISGGLRAASINTALIRAAAASADPMIEVLLYRGDLPHFNPDLEGSEPATVTSFRRQVRDGLADVYRCEMNARAPDEDHSTECPAGPEFLRARRWVLLDP